MVAFFSEMNITRVSLKSEYGLIAIGAQNNKDIGAVFLDNSVIIISFLVCKMHIPVAFGQRIRSHSAKESGNIRPVNPVHPAKV
jgi:hypothetical protein